MIEEIFINSLFVSILIFILIYQLFLKVVKLRELKKINKLMRDLIPHIFDLDKNKKTLKKLKDLKLKYYDKERQACIKLLKLGIAIINKKYEKN